MYTTKMYILLVMYDIIYLGPMREGHTVKLALSPGSRVRFTCYSYANMKRGFGPGNGATV